MLDFNSIRLQIEEFKDFEQHRTNHRHEQLEKALMQLRECGTTWPAVQEHIYNENLPWLAAYPLSKPDARRPPAQRTTPITITASDGSQIFPDDREGIFWYVLQTGGVAFQYGTLEAPLFERKAVLEFEEREWIVEENEGIRKISIDYISSIRDVSELAILLEVSQKALIPGRPILALVDGTLIRWMLRSMHRPELEEQLLAQYTDLLKGFQVAGIPVCSYISRPASTEVINLLRFTQGEHKSTQPDSTFMGLTDGQLFYHHLNPGERSSVFESRSRILMKYPEEQRILFYYLHVPSAGGGEIARVEMPHWVGMDPRALELTHAVLLSECEKGRGYPVILGEAHENVVIRSVEKERVRDLVEKVFQEAGIEVHQSMKNTFKRRPIV